MIIKRITVKNFGSVEFYDTVLTSKLNILDDGILEGRQKLISYLYTMDLLKKSQS